MRNSTKVYSLRKSRNILKSAYSCYRKKKERFSSSQIEELEKDMERLDQALLRKNRQEASPIAQKLQDFLSASCKKSFIEYLFELFFALILALAIAIIVRQMWFEPYEIPTGSMRPTFKEQDHLTVTKTAFGINFPLQTRHLYFDPNLVQRSSIFIFSADGLPIVDSETTYFWILPSIKRYIKRLIAKPGDSVYFYGGQLYAVDKNGNELKDLRYTPWMENLEYVPFLSFEGEVVPGNSNSIYFQQMHQKIGRVLLSSNRTIRGEIFNGKEWVKDRPSSQRKAHDKIETFSDINGMRNYAMARLLTKEELKQIPHLDTQDLEEGILYLQLIHTPNLVVTDPSNLRTPGGITVNTYTTVIPLQQRHLDAIMNSMYTARFVVKNGRARRYSVSDSHFYPGSPAFPGVPDGTYEFYHGKASKIYWQGVSVPVAKDHPLYQNTPSNIQRLFNLGIEMSTAFEPSARNHTLFPHRYAYFRNGDLFLLGAPIMKADDPILTAFNERELKRQENGKQPYVAFRDYGPPLKDSAIDVDFIRTFGVTIPEKNYLALGDNHAMSSDSRVFGFVPENNLQGAPSFIIWPPSDRLGAPPQKPYPLINLPRSIIWSIAALILGTWYALHRRRLKKPIFVKK